MRAHRLLVTGAVAAALLVVVSSQAWAVSDDRAMDEGRELFENACSSCHGADARGTSLGPSLEQSGEAGVDFMLRTGRMPLDDPDRQPVRKPAAFTEGQIKAITEFVGGISSGPEIPHVDLEATDLVEGQELFSGNCAACHSSAGAGGAVGAGLEAPGLSKSSPVEIVEAMRIGPGAMPVFDETTLSEEEANSIAKYLVYLRDLDDPGGLALNRIGPIAEGFVTWLIGVGLLLGIAKWIGEKE